MARFEIFKKESIGSRSGRRGLRNRARWYHPIFRGVKESPRIDRPILGCYIAIASRELRAIQRSSIPGVLCKEVPIPILTLAAGLPASARPPLVPAQGFHGDILGLILHSGPMAQVVVLVLAAFSILSWAIMVERRRALSRADREDAELMRRLRSSASLADIRDYCERLPFSPMAHIYRAGFKEIARGPSGRPASPGGLAVATEVEIGSASAIRVLERAMMSASSEAMGSLERYLGFLASTASATPFIGLFGTVWGIMNAFRSIGMIGTANLATVAPGISEALIATAAGLAAAIPAVLGYNYFNNRLRLIGNRLDNFIAEILNRFEKAS